MQNSPLDRTAFVLVASSTAALFGASICCVIAFIAFTIVGTPLETIVHWMIALTMVCFSGTFIGVYFGASAQTKRIDVNARSEAARTATV